MLGDFWENRKAINILTLNKAINFLKEFEKREIQVYMVLGNHDIAFKNTSSINSIDPIFSRYSNIHIIPSFEVINFDGLDVRIRFLDYIRI